MSQAKGEGSNQEHLYVVAGFLGNHSDDHAWRQ
jgi:hypothetical protein